LAGRESVCLEDLGDCVVLKPKGAIPGYMEEAFNPFFTPSGRPVPRGPEVATWHEEMSVVHSGEAVTAVVADAARYYPWPGLAYLPIRDAPPCRWVLVWRTAGETPLVRALAQAARATTAHQAVSRPIGPCSRGSCRSRGRGRAGFGGIGVRQLALKLCWLPCLQMAWDYPEEVV
jgi:hypothetical protein